MIGHLIRRLWRYLWRLSDQTKRYLRLDGAAMAEDLGATEEEREFARRMFTDGGETKSDDADGSANGGDADEDGDDDRSPFDVGGDYGLRKRVGFFLGPIAFALAMLAPTPAGLDPSGQAVAAVTAWVAIWWISEAIPIPATSLLPIVLFPTTGAIPLEETTAPYADPLIFLFMGGFFLAMAMQRWGLHRRIALRTIRLVGSKPSRIILGFMLATAFLSMWVSNSATVMMMVPIALAVVYQTAEMIDRSGPDIETREGEFTFGVALMLCIAYGASVGGVATLIGTPPNIIFAGVVGELYGQDISFAFWMRYGVPISVIGLAIVYVYVTKLVLSPKFDELPGGTEVIDDRLEQLGAISRQEKLVLVVFVGMAAAWISREFLLEAFVPGIDDTVIAIAGALVLFLTPTTTDEGRRTFLLDWTSGVEIPWGVILLFGGGLSIAAGFQESGLAEWLGEQLVALEGVSLVLILLVVVTLTVFLTEVTSNTATAAMLMPVLGALAVAIGVHPYALMVGAVTAASFAFMLPVATPPNAIVFGSGYISIPQMAKVGVGLNLIGILLITLLALFWLPVAWGIEIAAVPEWAG
jgi:solute carrier family 13 (sodium-dependent dicarboxylate transporter), member 2/3/5